MTTDKEWFYYLIGIMMGYLGRIIVGNGSYLYIIPIIIGTLIGITMIKYMEKK